MFIELTNIKGIHMSLPNNVNILKETTLHVLKSLYNLK